MQHIYVKTFYHQPRVIDSTGNIVMARIHENTKRIDHDSAADRKWLFNHTFWAMRNLREIELSPETGDTLKNLSRLDAESTN